ncbi:Xre family transcriptional regulator [Rhodothalassium salexigens DSM 2132]|uniref:Xre family transcriptional regulator n=1 Tax=Rhodothalassium salexigens DSM 2132 TaxID=1188247 RepID=A0A4R2PLL6_RHOSA|nr:helix-turn-helix transcriptional regulator [Rhodothalassium salexigens]MBK1638716.1 hypothetical protein [Rhodothalassium salexigens DSM 2132]TCP36357.1 Xre family transcriptional regulator [Rhodothalassium salexigens DSM 2132]
MIHARIREIRKAKGMTLQQVAERVRPQATTAQTIGRLETGARALTLDWVDKIAVALQVDPADLLALPDDGDLLVNANVGADGRVRESQEGVVALRLFAHSPIALRVSVNLGQYRDGDTVVCETVGEGDADAALGLDCYAEDADGNRYFAKLAPGSRAGCYSLLPLSPGGVLHQDMALTRIAPAVTLIRELSR